MQAGVRSLSRSLAAMCRHVAVQIVSQQDHAQAEPHQELQDPSASAVSKHSQAHQMPQSSAHAQQHQQQQFSCAIAPQNVHATSDQPCQRPHADLDASALESGLESSTAASAGPSLWGGLLKGFKGALTTPRQHSQGVKCRRGASHQPGQAARHPDHSHLHLAEHLSHAVHAGHHSEGQHPYQRHSSKAVSGLMSVPSSKAQLPGMGESIAPGDEGHFQGQASELHGGADAGMVKPAHSEVGMFTVTTELIEEVLGPRKYDDTDAAVSLVAPGDLQTAMTSPCFFLRQCGMFLQASAELYLLLTASPAGWHMLITLCFAASTFSAHELHVKDCMNTPQTIFLVYHSSRHRCHRLHCHNQCILKSC